MRPISAVCFGVPEQTRVPPYSPVLPLKQSMPFAPEWVVGLKPNIPIDEFVFNPNNYVLYTHSQIQNRLDLFVYRSADNRGDYIVLKPNRDRTGYAYAVEHVGFVDRIPGGWSKAPCGGFYAMDEKIFAMADLQRLDWLVEQRIMYIHQRQYTDAFQKRLLYMLNLS